MGILDDLKESMGGGGSSKGGGQVSDPNDTTNLGLGGLKSLLGTRGPAGEGARGDAQMAKTLGDSLPGYFDPTTRDYVPWYVDLFNGGGINAAGGSEGQTEQGGAMNAQSAIGAMRPQQRANPLEPFGGAGPNIPESQLGPFGGSGPAINQNNQQSGQLYSPINADQYDYPSYAQASPQNLASQTTSNFPARPSGGMLSPPAEAAPTTSSEDSFLDRLLSGEIAASNRATLDGDVETEAFVNPTPSVNNNVQPELRDSVINDLRKDVYTTGPVEGLLNWLKGDSEGINSDQQIKDYQSNYDERQRNMPYNPKYGVFYNEMKNSGADINNPDVFDQWLKQRGL